MKKLRVTIDQITEFGINAKVSVPNKIGELRMLLVEIYSEFLNIKSQFDNMDYDEEPQFDYEKIRQNVVSNFPNFGWYGTVLDINNIYAQEEGLGIGDALDDLTDIIIDLLEVKWRFENTNEIDALWHFEFLMRSHSERHLINLLKYLKESEL